MNTTRHTTQSTCTECKGEGAIEVPTRYARSRGMSLWELPPGLSWCIVCPSCGGKNGRVQREGRIHTL